MLVGFDTSDDAGIYKLSDELAIIMTADFITPPTDDPYLFGQIAAANAISDVYAMGGRPIAALNLVSFPSKKLPPEHLNQIIAGALSKITEAGAVLAGGHSVEDDEPKFGLSVTGVVHPEKYWPNAGARPGDEIVLTKAVGSGVIFNANLKGWVSGAAYKACLDSVTALNRRAAEVLGDFDVHAATDITGFGLAGHGLEMARGSGVRIALDHRQVPVMAEVAAMYERGVTTGVNKHNRRVAGEHITFERALPPHEEEIYFDPQTSGGLFAAVAEGQGEAAVKALHEAGIAAAALVGRASADEGGGCLVVR